MPKRRPQRQRYDAYGRPLPTLAEVGTPRSLLDSPANEAARQALLALLKTHYAYCCEEGFWGELIMTITVENGTMQQAYTVAVHRHHGPRRGGPDASA